RVPDEADWAAATPALREELLRAALDADPVATRAFLRNVLPTERSDTQERLLRVLAERPDPADATLEDVLDGLRRSRSRAVVSGATTLLARLPGTAFQTRMESRLRELAHVLETKGRRGAVPAALTDEAAVADGLPGEIAGPVPALEAALRLSHPDTVLRALGGPQATVALVEKHGGAQALIASLSNGPAEDLALAVERLLRATDRPSLLPHLPLAERERRALDWLATATT
ncbi:DUF5691 domain-containing protein, partial [Deinococcus pimensis]|uniref:DUF5691 domain-containing protein n=1 Tax=Deinococcus pimensis TaxID=309888 RepID=UPI0005EB5526